MNFQEKLIASISAATKQWWENLTKEELLEYISTQPQIDANYLRTMLTNEGIKLQFGTSFSCPDGTSEVSI